MTDKTISVDILAHSRKYLLRETGTVRTSGVFSWDPSIVPSVSSPSPWSTHSSRGFRVLLGCFVRMGNLSHQTFISAMPRYRYSWTWIVCSPRSLKNSSMFPIFIRKASLGLSTISTALMAFGDGVPNHWDLRFGRLIKNVWVGYSAKMRHLRKSLMSTISWLDQRYCRHRISLGVSIPASHKSSRKFTILRRQRHKYIPRFGLPRWTVIVAYLNSSYYIDVPLVRLYLPQSRKRLTEIVNLVFSAFALTNCTEQLSRAVIDHSCMYTIST
jgi:hypothetical protein